MKAPCYGRDPPDSRQMAVLGHEIMQVVVFDAPEPPFLSRSSFSI